MESAPETLPQQKPRSRWQRVKFALKLLVCAATLCAIVGVVVRTWWVCSHTEGGWEILRDHLAAGLPPFVPVHGGERDQHPIEQAAHWMLAQCDRIAADPNSTAADYMGAAFTTCALASDKWWAPDWPSPDATGSLQWCSVRVAQYSTADVRSFVQSAMYSRLKDMATKACQLEPTCAAWWRLRAALMFFCQWQEDPCKFDVSILEDSKSHDPNNALYDYLLADLYYRHATTSAWLPYSNDAPNLVIIRDYASFRRCVKHYRHALGKPFLSIGFDRFSVAGKFIANAPGGVKDKLTLILYDLPWALGSPIRSAIGEPIWDGIKTHLSQQDFAGAIYLWQRGGLRPVLQSEACGELAVSAGDRSSSIAMIDQELTEQLKDNPENGVLRDAIDELCKSCPISAFERQWVSSAPRAAQKLWDEWAWLQMMETSSVAAVSFTALGYLLMLASAISYLTALAIGWRITPPSKSHLSAAVAIWIVALVVTGAVLGYLPALQPTIALASTIGAVSSLAAVLVPIAIAVSFGGRYVSRQAKKPPQDRTWMYHLVRWSLVIVWSFVFVVVLLFIVDRKIRQWVCSLPEIRPGSYFVSEWGASGKGDPSHLASRLRVERRTVSWAFVQWAVHGGVYWTAGLGLLSLIGLNWRRSKKIVDGATALAIARRMRWSIALRQTAKGTAVFAVFLLLVSIAATTEWINALRCQYDLELDRLSDPYWLTKQVAAQVQQTEADGLGQSLEEAAETLQH